MTDDIAAHFDRRYQTHLKTLGALTLSYSSCPCGATITACRAPNGYETGGGRRNSDRRVLRCLRPSPPSL
jgi:hypothetical protein